MDDLKNISIAILGATVITLLSIAFFAVEPSIWFLVSVFLVSYPWKFGKNVCSLFGGANKDGTVYSLINMHSTGKKVWSLLSFSSFSKSTEGDIFSFCGISFCGRANTTEVMVCGILLCSDPKIDCQILFGISVLCCPGYDLVIALGYDFFSAAKAYVVLGWFGILLFTKAGNDISTILGIPILVSAENVYTRIGIPILVRAKNEAILGFGISLGQFGEKTGISWKTCVKNDYFS